jgi:hypothetical protein
MIATAEIRASHVVASAWYAECRDRNMHLSAHLELLMAWVIKWLLGPLLLVLTVPESTRGCM